MKTSGIHTSYISGIGSYLPEKLLTNADLEKMVDTSDAWITERTGIKQRHIAAPDQQTSDQAFIAAQKALQMAGLQPQELECIIFATVTPDQPMPSAACELQAKLKTGPIMAFDIAAACSGFIYALTIAHQFVRAGQYKNVLIVGAETLSRVVDYRDRETCILFGDGAGVAIVSRAPEGSVSRVMSCHTHADGELGELFVLGAGGSRLPFSQAVIDGGLHYMRMRGREIFKHAVRSMASCCQEALAANNMTAQDLDWVIPHQANLRIIEAVAKHLEVPMNKVIINIENMGNTSAATIPIALSEAIAAGRVQRGQKILLTAFGAGLTSGAVLMQF